MNLSQAVSQKRQFIIIEIMFIAGLLTVERTTSFPHDDKRCRSLCSAEFIDKKYSLYIFVNKPTKAKL